MPADEIHVGDVGTVFIVTIKDGDDLVDISSATTKSLLFRKPNGDLLTKTASLVNDGTDGQMKYISVSGDIDVDGTWTLQGLVAIGTGSWHTDLHTFKVHRNV